MLEPVVVTHKIIDDTVIKSTIEKDGKVLIEDTVNVLDIAKKHNTLKDEKIVGIVLDMLEAKLYTKYKKTLTKTRRLHERLFWSYKLDEEQVSTECEIVKYNH